MIEIDDNNVNYIIVNDITKEPYKVRYTNVATRVMDYDFVSYDIIGGKYKVSYSLPSINSGEYVIEILTTCDEVIYKSLAHTKYDKDKIETFINNDDNIIFYNND